MTNQTVEENQGKFLFYAVFTIATFSLGIITILAPASDSDFVKALFGSCFIIMGVVFGYNCLMAALKPNV